jgi:ribosomal subunit interface protein
MINITARHIEVGEEVRMLVQQKGRWLLGHLGCDARLEVVLDQDAHSYRAEMILTAARGTRLICHASHSDLVGAVEAAAAKLDRQVRKLKQKRIDRRSEGREATGKP